MIAWLLGILGILGTLILVTLSDLVSEELRGWLELAPHAILRLAAAQLDKAQYENVYQTEWLPELEYILKKAESRPITRLIRGTTFAFGLFISARRIARQLDRGKETKRAPSTPRVRRSLTLNGLTRAGALRFSRDEGRVSSWHVLRHRDFRLYFAGSLASNLGTWLQTTAQVLLVYQLTHSVFAVGAVTCVQFSGSLLLGPYAAALADRLGNRCMLIGAQFFAAGVATITAALQFSGLLTADRLIIAALAMGLAFTITLPVQTATVPRLVPEGDIGAAMAMNSISYNSGRALAPVLCVAVITSMGFGWVFALNAISFGVFAATLFLARPRAIEKPTERTRPGDGIRIARRQPRIILLLVMVAAVTVAGDPVFVLGPTLAHHLGTSDVWPAYFLSALGCGSVLGSLLRIKTAATVSSSGISRRAAWSLLGLGIAIIVFAAGVSPLVSLLAAFAAGMTSLRVGAATQSLLIQQVRQRAASVMALWALVWAGSKPLASLADGLLASNMHLSFVGATLATPAIVLAILEIYLPGSVKHKLKINGGPRARPTVVPYPP